MSAPATATKWTAFRGRVPAILDRRYPAPPAPPKARLTVPPVVKRPVILPDERKPLWERMLARLKCRLRGRHEAVRQAVGGFRCAKCGFGGGDLGEMGYIDCPYVRGGR